jgi:transcriptional regulator with XRE-family HTH domain
MKSPPGLQYIDQMAQSTDRQAASPGTTAARDAAAKGAPGVMSDVAATVRRLRHGRGLSADQLAARAGVSKGALVALENAAANPNLATLVRLADALGVSVSALVEQQDGRRVQVSDAAATEPLWRGPSGGSLRLLLTTPTAAPVELWRWHLADGERYESHPHPAGVVETITVISGAAVITVDGTEYPARAGQTVTFAADAAHAYRGGPGGDADLLMTVHLPEPSPRAAR